MRSQPKIELADCCLEQSKLHLTGDWTIESLSTSVIARVEAKIKHLALNDVTGIDCARIYRLDTAGVLLLSKISAQISDQTKKTELIGLNETHRNLMNNIAHIQQNIPPSKQGAQSAGQLAMLINQAGYQIFQLFGQSLNLLGFLGYVTTRLTRLFIWPLSLRWTSLVSHLDRSGIQALPIVGLLSFLIGIVLSFQGVDQLTQFGAEIFTVNLVALSMTREMGVLITAILIAGRSGSSFTAEIGAMKINEEVDAIRTLGLNPIDVLVVPRILALIIVLPLLTFFANFMGIMGGGLMLWVILDIEPGQYVNLVQQAVSTTGFWLGIIKAPVFAFFIGLVSCFHGMRVRGSTEEVGLNTTRAVVESIFYVIMLDAVFSVIFSILKV